MSNSLWTVVCRITELLVLTFVASCGGGGGSGDAGGNGQGDINFGWQDVETLPDISDEDVPSDDQGSGPDAGGDVLASLCEPNPCLQSPQNTCNADGLRLTVYDSPGQCVTSGAEYNCSYPSSIVDCSKQNMICSAGKCMADVDDPCDSDPCTNPPESECGEDGLTVLSYSLPAYCTVVAGEAACEYSVTTTDCADTGKVCNSGSCVVQSDPCSPNPCVAPPSDYCSGDILNAHPNPGKCLSSGGAFMCDYAPNKVNCASSGMACEGQQCVPVAPPNPGPEKAGDVIVSEFMAKSQASTDLGEWVELYNTTSTELDLYGCFLADAQSDNHKIAVSVLISPGARVLLARSGDVAVNHGLNPDYVYSGFAMANSGDEIVLICDGVTIDSVVYESAWVKQGVSIQLDPAEHTSSANDVFEHWCFGTSSYGTDGLSGTPGGVNTVCSTASSPCEPNPCTVPGTPTCGDSTTVLTPQSPGVCTPAGQTYSCDYPSQQTNCASTGKVCSQGQCVTSSTGGMPSAAGQVVFSEFMAKSVAGSSDKGEFLEVYNTTLGALDLKDCIIRDKAGSHTVSLPLSIVGHGYVLLAMSSDAGLNYGLSPDYVYTGIQLNNDGETMKLECSGVVIDEFTYTSTWVVEGASTQLSSSKLDSTSNDNKASWCTSTAQYGTGAKLGTPGEANIACP